MKTRVALLAVVLVAVAAGATHVAGRLEGKPDALRVALLWALPAVVFLCGRFALGSAHGVPAGLRPALRRSPWIGLAIGLDLAPIGVGYLAGWLTLTYGDQALAASRATTALWALPLLVLVSWRFFERTLRGGLYTSARSTFGEPTAWALSIGCGTLLALPALAPGFEVLEGPFLAAGLATAVAREVVCTALFRDAGLAAAGLYRGVLVFVDGYLIHDWLSPVFPSANYVTSTDAFYFARAAGPIAAALLFYFLLRRTTAVLAPAPAEAATSPPPA